MWWQRGSATSWKGACLSQLGLGSGCQHHTYMVWQAEMAILRTWNPHMESCSNASGVASNFTLYFKVSMHVPMKSSSNHIYFHALYKLPSQEYNMKMYKVTQGHAGGSRCTQTSTQPFSLMCWGHDEHEKCEKEWKHFQQGNKSNLSNAAILLKFRF